MKAEYNENSVTWHGAIATGPALLSARASAWGWRSSDGHQFGEPAERDEAAGQQRAAGEIAEGCR